MFHGVAASSQPWMAHHKGRAHSCGDRQEIQQTDRMESRGHCGKRERTHEAGFAGLRGGGCCSFDHATSAALFADRCRMDQRAEFRGQMHEIRHEIRDLMGTVENGQLTAEQQETFDGYVQEMVDLREEFGIRSWRGADAADVAERILNRFGIEPAHVCGCGVEDTQEEPVTDGGVVPVTETTETAATTETETIETSVVAAEGETPVESGSVEAAPVDTGTDESASGVTDAVDTVPEVTESPVEETAGETKTLDAEAISALVDKLASTIVDAESLIEELVNAIG